MWSGRHVVLALILHVKIIVLLEQYPRTSALFVQGKVLDHQELHVTSPQADHPCHGTAVWL